MSTAITTAIAIPSVLVGIYLILRIGFVAYYRSRVEYIKVLMGIDRRKISRMRKEEGD